METEVDKWIRKKNNFRIYLLNRENLCVRSTRGEKDKYTGSSKLLKYHYSAYLFSDYSAYQLSLGTFVGSERADSPELDSIGRMSILVRKVISSL